MARFRCFRHSDETSSRGFISQLEVIFLQFSLLNYVFSLALTELEQNVQAALQQARQTLLEQSKGLKTLKSTFF